MQQNQWKQNKENEGKTVLGRRKPKKQKKKQNLSQKKNRKHFSTHLINKEQISQYDPSS